MIVGVLFTGDTGPVGGAFNYHIYTTDTHRGGLWTGLILQNQAYAGIGDAGGLQPSAVAGSLYLSLHSAEPGLDGDQSTNELAYPGYARAACARDTVSATRLGLIEQNAAFENYAIQRLLAPGVAGTFPLVGVTINTFVATHIGIGTESAGAGKLIGYSPFMRAVPLKQDMGYLLSTSSPVLFIF